jgi:hypothetical protein
MLLGSKHSR